MSRQIVQLGAAHAEALQNYLAEWGDEDVPGYFCPRDWSHHMIVRMLAAWSRGEELDGKVPCTTSFLVEDGEILGNSNFRHSLNDRLSRYGAHVGYAVRPSARRQGVASELLAEVVTQARTRGLQRLIVTCDPDNPGSIGTIVNNGGVLQEQYFHEGQRRDVSLYWIDLSRVSQAPPPGSSC